VHGHNVQANSGRGARVAAAAALYTADESETLETVAAKLGVSFSAVGRYLSDAGIATRGFRSRHPAPTDRICACGCGRIVRPTRTQDALGRGKYYSSKCWGTHAKGNPEVFDAAREECRRYQEQHDLLTRAEASVLLGVSASVLSWYEQVGLLAPKERRRFSGRPPFVLYSRRDVKIFAKERRLSGYIALHRDPDWVFRWALRRGTALDDAERLRSRVIERNRRRALIRTGTGRPKSATEYHIQWFERFTELKAELDAQHESLSALGIGLDDPAPTDMGVALLVAEEDFAEHPERWKYDPKRAPRAAADRIRNAVRRHNHAGTKLI
jgi:hypothetical protein